MTGDRPNLPLGAEPVAYLHTDRVTAPLTVGVQPVAARLPLESEPVLWPSPGRVPEAADGVTVPRPAPRPGGTRPAGDGSPLPTTGAGMPVWTGLLAIAAAGALRARAARR